MKHRNTIGLSFLAAWLILAGFTGCTSSFQTPVSSLPPPPAGCGNFQAVTVQDYEPASTFPPVTVLNPFFVIRNQTDWNNYCVNYSPVPLAPVNFAQSMLLVYSQMYSGGSCPFDFIDITDVCYSPSQITVTYGFRAAGLNMTCQSLVCAQILTLGCVTRAVAVPQSTLPVVWVKNDHCPAPTPLPAPPASGIYWQDCEVNLMPGLGICAANLILSVNGTAETNDAVTLSVWDPAGSIGQAQMTYDYSSGAYAYYSGYVNIPPSSIFTYTVTADTSLGPSSASLTSPDQPLIDPNGNQVSWALEGNADWVRVWSYRHEYVLFDTRTTAPDAASVLAIPGSAYPITGDNYMIEAETANTTNNVLGATPNSFYKVYYLASLTLQK